jgi:hypothetical protein
MRRLLLFLFVAGLVSTANPVFAAYGRVTKVLPFFLDLKGHHALHPSLYERDAYQAYLRQHPEMRSGMMFHVKWKVSGKPSAPLRLRLQLRGTAEGNLPRELLVEKPVKPGGWFGQSSELTLSGEEYSHLREITAWRVTLWEGEDLLLGEQQSFLW